MKESLPATEENKQFAEIFNHSVDEASKLDIGTEEITGLDIIVTHYFITKLNDLAK